MLRTTRAACAAQRRDVSGLRQSNRHTGRSGWMRDPPSVHPAPRRVEIVMSRPAAVLIVFLALVVPGRAQAGSYTVDACGFGVGAAQNSWTVEASTPLIEAYNICAGGSNDGDEFISHAGFGVRTQRSASLLPGYASAYWRFDAPTGAKIIGLRTNSADRVTQGPVAVIRRHKLGENPAVVVLAVIRKGVGMRRVRIRSFRRIR
jgi:hypothetical protein